MSLSDLPTDILDEISRQIAKITDRRALGMTNKHVLAILEKHVQFDILNIPLINDELEFEYCIDYEKASDGYYNLISANAPVTILAYYGLIDFLRITENIYPDLAKYAVYGNQPKVLLYLIISYEIINVDLLAEIAASRGYLDCLKILYKKTNLLVNNHLCCAAIPHYDCFYYLFKKLSPWYNLDKIMHHVIEQDNLDCFKLLGNYGKLHYMDGGLMIANDYKSIKIKKYLQKKEMA